MASREQFLDDYEISRLLCDSDDEDDRHSDDDIGLSGSEDEEDAVEEDFDDDIDSVYDAADNGDHGEPENTDDEHSETGESTDKEKNVFQGKDFTSQSCSSSHGEHNSASSRMCGRSKKCKYPT
jgi:hypothetical protein